MAAYQYIYVMKRLSKIFPGGKKVLDNVTLAFLPGAKIGVLGVNGSGKSTLLRIMAGLDHDVGGEAWAADGVRVGFLPQEPELDPAKDVLGNVDGGRRRDQGAARPLRRGLGAVRRPRRRHGRADGRAGRAAGEDRGRGRLGIAAHARDRDGRAALPARGPGRRHALGRRAAPRGALPPAAVAARHAAARRADQPSGRRIGRLARAFSPRLSRARSSP